MRCPGMMLILLLAAFGCGQNVKPVNHAGVKMAEAVEDLANARKGFTTKLVTRGRHRNNSSTNALLRELSWQHLNLVNLS